MKVSFNKPVGWSKLHKFRKEQDDSIIRDEWPSQHLYVFNKLFVVAATSAEHKLCRGMLQQLQHVNRLKVHGHGQSHSRNFCRFKLDI